MLYQWRRRADLRISLYAGMALLLLVLCAVQLRSYVSYEPQAMPAPGGHCTSAQTLVVGRIIYNSGAELQYCALEPMFEQLGAQEQGDVVRIAQVRMEDGRWLPVSAFSH
jgi:hypothetical protein